MGYGYPEEVIQDFIDDYQEEYNITLPFDDALRMLSLFDGLCALLEKYEGDDGRGDCLPLRMMPTYKKR